MSKVLLITGASRGIGAETARLAAARGYSLCLNYLHSDDAANELLDSLIAGGHQAILYQADVGQESEVDAMYRAIDREFGRLDGLVNNAGILEQQSDLVDMTPQRWRRVLDINVIGSFLCAREAVKRMSTKMVAKVAPSSTFRRARRISVLRMNTSTMPRPKGRSTR